MSMLSNVQNHWHPWHWFVFEQEDSPSMFEDDLRCRWWWWWSNTTLLPILPQRATRCASRGWRFHRFLRFLLSPPPNQTCVPVKNVVGVAMVFNNTNKVSIPSDRKCKDQHGQKEPKEPKEHVLIPHECFPNEHFLFQPLLWGGGGGYASCIVARLIERDTMWQKVIKWIECDRRW